MMIYKTIQMMIHKTIYLEILNNTNDDIQNKSKYYQMNPLFKTRTTSQNMKSLVTTSTAPSFEYSVLTETPTLGRTLYSLSTHATRRLGGSAILIS